MRQVLLRATASLGTSAINIALDSRESAQSGFADLVSCIWPIAGTFRHLSTSLSAAPGGSATRACTLYVNGSATALVSSHGSGEVDSVDAAHTVTVAAGDRLLLVCSVTGTPAAADLQWSIECDSFDATTSAYATNVGSADSGFVDPFTGRTSATALDCQRLIPCTGVLTGTSMAQLFTSVGGGVSLTAAWYLNGVLQDGSGGTVDTRCVLSGTAQYEADTVTYVLPVVRGDRVYLGLTESGAYPAGYTSIGVVFQAAVADQSILTAIIGDNPSDSVASYGILQGPGTGGRIWSTSNTFLRQLRCGVTPVTLSALLLEVSDDPGAGNTRTFELLSGSSVPTDTPTAVVVTGGLTVSDAETVTFAPGDAIGPMRHTPASAPTVTGREWWSFVMGAVPPPPDPGGEVPAAVNPATADLPTGVTRHFFTLTIAGDVIAQAETTLRDAADYYGGFKSPTLLSVSDIDRSLAPQGEFRPVQVTVRVADVDRRFRTAAQSATLSTAYGAIYVISDTDRYAEAVPYRIFGGRVVDHGTDDGFHYEFTLRDALTEMIGDLDQAARVPPFPLSKTLFGGLDDAMDGKVAPVILGHLTDETETPPQGVVSPIIVGEINFQTAFGGIDQDVIAAIWSGGALSANGLAQVFVNLPDAPDVRIPIPGDLWGVALWMPGMAGWADTGIATDYVDYPTSGPDVRRYTPIFIAADLPPYSQAVREGRMLLAANPYGLSADAVGGDVYLSDPSRIWQWILVNQGFVPYKTGTYATIPTLDGTYSVVNTDSVERTRTRQHARLAGGYPVGVVVGRSGAQQMFTHILGELCEGTDMEQGIDRHGRAMVDAEDATAAPVAHLSDLHDIEAGSFTIQVDRSQHFNRLEHFIGFRHTPPSAPRATPPAGEPVPQPIAPFSPWVAAMREPQHDDSITAQGGKVITRKVENYVVRDPAVAADLETRWLARAVGPDAAALDGPKRFTLRGPLVRLLGLELGDNVLLTHCEGLGATGYEGRLARVMRLAHALQTRRTTVEGYILPEGDDE